jgi:hypothetical protein
MYLYRKLRNVFTKTFEVTSLNRKTFVYNQKVWKNLIT